MTEAEESDAVTRHTNPDRSDSHAVSATTASWRGRYRGLFVIVLWIGIAAAVGLWIQRTPIELLRDQLRRWQFWQLEVLFFGVASLSALCVPAFLRSLELSRRQIALALCLSALAFSLVSFVAPRTNRIYFDEHIYQNVAQNLTDLHLAQMCNDGNAEYGMLQCWRGEYNKEPYGYPYVLSLVYRLVGVHEGVAFVVNGLAAAAMVLVVFLVTTTITRRPEAGYLAGFIATLIPDQLRWSHTAAAEPSAAFACVFAVMATFAFVRLRSTTSLFWTVFATAFAIQFRPECVLIVPVVLLVIVLFAPQEMATWRFWFAGAIGLALVSVHLAHITAVRNESWGSAGPRFSTAYFAQNLRVNGGFFLGDGRFPFVYTILAVAGLASSFRLRAALIPLVQFLLFWGVFLFFYAGSYNYGADDRFSLMCYPPMAMMAGIGAHALTSRTAERLRSRRTYAVAYLALGVQFLWYAPMARSIGEEAWAARADVKFARAFVRELPANSFVLTHNPNMFHLWGQSAGQASIAANEREYYERMLLNRYAGGIYFHWNFWCDVADPVQQRFCSDLLERFPHTLVREYRERDYRYALYRIEQPTLPAESRRE